VHGDDRDNLARFWYNVRTHARSLCVCRGVPGATLPGTWPALDPGENWRCCLGFVWTITLILLAVLVLALILSLGVTLIGWVLGAIFGLSLFQGAIIGLVATIGIGYVIYRILEPAPFMTGFLPSDDWEEEEEIEPDVVPASRQRRRSSRSGGSGKGKR
jgi:hypothetical protein